MTEKGENSSEIILDFLQTVYPIRIDVKKIPISLRDSFFRAVERFQKPEELKKLDRSSVGVCEEVADLTYQILKMICLQEKILTEKTIQILQDYLIAENR